ncbi:UNVERIFIED_CONTAM: Retrovirus-related Pol polyprotein from transposon RE2, partial [Sesamum calycinum]
GISYPLGDAFALYEVVATVIDRIGKRGKEDQEAPTFRCGVDEFWRIPTLESSVNSLPPSYDPFIINYNMNGLEKSIHELINILVQYEATTHKSAPVVLVGKASTSKAKDKDAGRWKKKEKGKVTTATASAEGAPATASGKGKGKGRVGGSQRSKANDVRMHCQGKGHWKRECPQLLSNPGIFVIEVNMITNAAFWVLDTGYGAHICNNLQMLERSRKLSKDEMILRLGDGNAIAAEAGYALETAAKLLNIAPSKMSRAYENCILDMASGGYVVRHGHHKPYPVQSEYVARTVDSKRGSVPCHYTTESSSMHLAMTFVSRKAVFLEKGFSVDNRRDEVLLEESSESPQQDNAASFKPSVLTDSVPVLHRSTRESRPLERYGFVGLTSQLDNDPKTYGEAMSDIDSDKWLEVMKSEMDWMGSSQVWTLVDPPKGVKPVGCKWVYKCKLGANGEVITFKARLVAKGYTQRPGVDFEETYSPVAMAKSIRILLAIVAWPDVAYALSVTSRYQSCAGEAHWSMVKTILKYLRSYIFIYGSGQWILEGYSYASFQSDDDDAKSQSGFVFRLNGGVVSRLPQQIPPQKLNTYQFQKQLRKRFG